MLLNITTLNNIVYEIIEQKKNNKDTKQTKSNTEDEDIWGEAKRK